MLKLFNNPPEDSLFILYYVYIVTKTGTKEVTVKGILKVGIALTLLSALGACSTMKEIEIRETKANPKWYLDCEQIGKEGWLFGWNLTCYDGANFLCSRNECTRLFYKFNRSQIGTRKNGVQQCVWK